MPLKNSKILLNYVPHGINDKVYKPIADTDRALKDRRKKHFGDKQFDFVLFYNSRNIQRKRTSNIILAFRAFCDNLTPEQADKCALLLHTERVLDAGTDLPAVKNALCDKYNVFFDESKCSPEELVLDYNIGDVVINITSNEGFGLSIAEAVMCGTPVIANVTGGLQDQIGQVDDNGNPIEFGLNFGSNHTGKYKNHGVWSYPVYPAARYIQGSIPTPYIFDDICKWEDVAEGIMYWYLMSSENRTKCGAEGRRWALNEGGLSNTNMATQFIKSMNYVFDNFAPCKSFDLYTVDKVFETKAAYDSIGGEIPVIDKQAVNDQITDTINKLK
jgi:glycosyltransferase involved in cell wall biosynthesis